MHNISLKWYRGELYMFTAGDGKGPVQAYPARFPGNVGRGGSRGVLRTRSKHTGTSPRRPDKRDGYQAYNAGSDSHGFAEIPDLEGRAWKCSQAVFATLRERVDAHAGHIPEGVSDPSNP
jgi:hypothetical protein